jgi:hypothetical protein
LDKKQQTLIPEDHFAKGGPRAGSVSTSDEGSKEAGLGSQSPNQNSDFQDSDLENQAVENTGGFEYSLSTLDGRDEDT